MWARPRTPAQIEDVAKQIHALTSCRVFKEGYSILPDWAAWDEEWEGDDEEGGDWGEEEEEEWFEDSDESDADEEEEGALSPVRGRERERGEEWFEDEREREWFEDSDESDADEEEGVSSPVRGRERRRERERATPTTRRCAARPSEPHAPPASRATRTGERRTLVIVRVLPSSRPSQSVRVATRPSRSVPPPPRPRMHPLHAPRPSVSFFVAFAGGGGGVPGVRPRP